MSTSLGALLPTLEALAPLELGEPWDNVGLLAGHPAQPIDRLVVCNDWTPAVCSEVVAAGPLERTLVVAYHPPWFRPAKSLVRNESAALATAVASGAAIYSVHTAFDAARGGSNDCLAACAGVSSAQPLVPHVEPPSRLKLTVGVPVAAVAAVQAALLAAGAGTIGAYRGCSFVAAGSGHFTPAAGATPAAGTVGAAHEEPEAMVTSWLPAGDPAAQARVLAAVRASHPYEEPVIDVTAAAPLPSFTLGAGRIGALAAPEAFEPWLARLKQRVGARGALRVRAGDDARPVARVAVAVGAGRSLLAAAVRAGADTFVTGELPHHDALEAQARGLRVVALLHGQSERPGLEALSDALARALPAVALVRPTRDVEPYEFA